MIKYLVCPGDIISQSDNDVHYINARQLMRLYKVPMNECVIKNERGFNKDHGLIELKPKYNGDYTLPRREND